MLRKATDEEYKKQVTLLLSRVHNICTTNNIRYHVAFGSLLGVVRHKGFIPWDDDIDICMPREDYDRFSKAFTSDDGRYYTLDSQNSEYYFNNFFRACDGNMILTLKGIPNINNLGAYIDIFLLDSWPINKNEIFEYRSEITKSVKNLRFSLPWSSSKTLTREQKLKRVARFPQVFYNQVFVGCKKRKAERDAVLLKYSNQNTGWRSVSYDHPEISPWFIREEDIDKRILMPFENLMVYVPENYDELLRNRYGDYMQLPPVEQRKKHHHFTPYWSKI